MSDLSDLGTFQLGYVQLGHSLGQSIHTDSVTINDDGFDLTLIATIEDALTLSEILELALELLEADSIAGIIETFGTYPTEGWAGIIGRITLRMDVTWEDFCAMVDEAGMSIELNDEPCRGFCFVKQRSQQFEPGLGILPGDAVLFTCPADEITGPIKAGDVVFFDFAVFDVIAVRNKYFDGNIIYRKSLLRKRRYDPAMPLVQNLVASPNLEGSTKLTWDDIDPVYTYFDYYEIWESADGVDYFYRDKTRSNTASIANLPPNVKYYYKVRAVDKYQHAGEFSNVAETPIDDVPPAPPTGVR